MAKTRKGAPPASATPAGAHAIDDDAFARAMRDVVRLRPDARGRLPRLSPKDAGEVHAAAIVLPAVQPASDGEDRGDEAFAAAGVDRRELRRLKRGDYLPGKHSDLHGMSGDDACARVGRFLENSRHGGHRCVCIVHGRGLHSAGGAAVLRTRVRAYLRSHPAVLAYADAPSSDGGSGAVYVLLRK